MSGSFESVRWSACVHRLDLGLCPHPKEFSGNEVRSHVNVCARACVCVFTRACVRVYVLLLYQWSVQAVLFRPVPTMRDRLVGLVVRRPPRERKIPGSNPACVEIFSGSSHTRDLKIGTPVATLPDAWRYRVSTGTGRPGVSVLGEVERLICNF